MSPRSNPTSTASPAAWPAASGSTCSTLVRPRGVREDASSPGTSRSPRRLPTRLVDDLRRVTSSVPTARPRSSSARTSSPSTSRSSASASGTARLRSRPHPARRDAPRRGRERRRCRPRRLLRRQGPGDRRGRRRQRAPRSASGARRQLLTDQGLRGQVLREPGQTRGLPEPVIEAPHRRLPRPRRGSPRLDLVRARPRPPHRARSQGQPGMAPAIPPPLAAPRHRLGPRRPAWRVCSLRRPRAEGCRVMGAGQRQVPDRRRARVLSHPQLPGPDVDARGPTTGTTELTIDRGISLCQQGRADDGLLWLMRGLKQVHATDPPDPTRPPRAVRIAAWQRR